jgi:hypothetical protein
LRFLFFLIILVSWVIYTVFLEIIGILDSLLISTTAPTSYPTARGSAAASNRSVELRSAAKILIVLLQQAHMILECELCRSRTAERGASTEEPSVRELGLWSIWMCVLFMYRKFPSLSEGLRATIDPANKWLLSRVSVLMFLKVLRKYKSLFAMLTNVFLVIEMFHVVAFKREFGREKFLTVFNITLEHLLAHLMNILLI